MLTGLRLEPAGLRFDPETVVPAHMPDLFTGVPLCILGRYRGPATGALALQAHNSTGNAWTETVAATSSDNSAIASVWAQGLIRELEDRFASGSGNSKKLEKHIVETSLRFQRAQPLHGVCGRGPLGDRQSRRPSAGASRSPSKRQAGWAMFGNALTMCQRRPEADGGGRINGLRAIHYVPEHCRFQGGDSAG